ncbi:MAG: DUF2339 domain-containing protein [Terracidiphilus sp.]
MNPSESLEVQVSELGARVRRLEEALSRQGILSQEFLQQPKASATEASAPAVPWTAALEGRKESGNVAPVAAPPPSSRPAALPSFGYAALVADKDEQSLENRIGSHWFNRIGILAVLIGMAWFLKLAIDSQWIGPSGRVLIGLVAGGALIAWSERFRDRGYAIFSYSLKAVGSGTLYLSLWAAFSLYQLIPPGVAFVAMIAVTAFNGYMAWAQDAELLGLYAIAGALSTPLLVSTGENHEVTLFSYLLVLNVAMLALVALRPWSRLLFASFAGTAIFVLGWWSEFYSDAQFARTTFFVAIFFLIFAFAPRLVRVDLEDDAPHSGWDNLALVALPVLNAAFGFIAFYNLLDVLKSDWAEAFLAVGFAAFYLFMLQLPAQRGLRKSPRLLTDLHLTAAVVFLTIAIPLKAQGRWLTIGWLAEGAALLWMASRARLRLLLALALLCLSLGVGALLLVNPSASTTPIFNERFACYLAGIATLAFTAWVALKARTEPEQEALVSWPAIAAGAVLGMNALILVAFGWEIHSYWWVLRWTGDGNQWEAFQMSAQFTYSLWFMVYGAILLGLGFWRRSAFLRWQALVLLAGTVVKVFLYDMSALSQGYRILSFLGLGVLLFAVSFVYQRDWLKLRAAKEENNEA